MEGGTPLHPVSDTVEAVDCDGRRSLRCTVCQYRLGDYEDDPKRSASMRELPISDVSPVNVFCHPDYVLREFSCPGCGTAIAADVQHRDDPILDECRFFAPASGDVSGAEGL